jgi:hypothetical protein
MNKEKRCAPIEADIGETLLVLEILEIGLDLAPNIH